ncbi:hypothetical protein ADLP1_042 [Acinetobacter phage vB_AbaM_DLP1]|nr:hypothetical protein ADLP1_042 [Acinetobacter phage vB_AbaM_DLP1]
MNFEQVINTRPKGTVLIIAVESEGLYSYFDAEGNIQTYDADECIQPKYDRQWLSNYGFTPEDSIESLEEQELEVKVIFDIRK